ncbi:MAG: hypothetical protein A3F82_01050 [Deltaproteobacteria bacterium RIFCSPLOWO2_12_FULL_44_12]|nr:MAG: hypothetical protein A2712_03905 [Deltaproteobacteria bacterium RIFCSPHIGHO2_01_FULL_43_49]OGQ16331.1 MAG: hypothetical protein A3D22_01875 [Deltaproteobacteria bacterium RIFCSPHIGHO2_02_FULL_44_53]OGQ29291.1 MAG: hypothetical protein A3D98_05660 [Deltaproteobacteria bacterium RIFCSPHIGHO2_12_FULL_44_21]OGQ32848.1 MAG: hypothetical protein A2979_09805 [Deltaproteobacteria bacterium RIFCSPLOWO2_01_FULL_45_74]OGQ41949.1 MAG: hypothetical protein A3I70_09590 [Deltaproteobacteria bacterium 
MNFKKLTTILAVSLMAFSPAFAEKPYKTTVKTIRMSPKQDGIKWDLSFKKEHFPKILEHLREKGHTIDPSSQKALVAKLNKIMNRLKPKTLNPSLPFEVHLVQNDTVNAVCYPGGGILFFTGIFGRAEGLIDPQSDEEIAAVMGHEMAHATLRHAYKKQNTAMATNLIGSVISIGIGAGAGGDWQNLFNTVFDVSTGLYFPSYSRKHESEADLEGLYTLMDAKYKPDAAIRVWERASAKKGGRDKTSIFASHPADGKRAKDLTVHLATIKGSK